MSRELDKLRTHLMERDAREGEVGFPAPMSPPSGFFTFRYSSTEIFSQGGQLHVKLKETRYQDGRLKSEECEGTLDHQAYERIVSDAQNYFLNQMTGFMRLMFAPFGTHNVRGRHSDE
jgi:hypothetical protein